MLEAHVIENHPDEIVVFHRPELERLLERTRQEYASQSTLQSHTKSKGYLKRASAAKYADVSEGTIANWVKRGYINQFLTDGNTLYKISEIEAYLAKGKVGSA